MAKTETVELARAKIKGVQQTCRVTLRYEKQIIAVRKLIAAERDKLTTVLDRLTDVTDYLAGSANGGVDEIVVTEHPLVDIAEATESMIDTIEQVIDARNETQKFVERARKTIQDEEVKKQTWADLETDWPHVPDPGPPTPPNDNLVDAEGRVIIEPFGTAKSFRGEDIRNAVNRVEDLADYLAGTDGGITSPLTVPANPNRDIRELTIDDDVEE